MKYLKYFTKESDYQNYINGDSILRPNVSYSFESKDVSFNAVLPLDRKSIIGSIYLYDKINKSYSFCTQDELTIEKYPSEQYLPVGIVVIPASHDVYGTGECGIVSLMNMDYSNPEKGSSSDKYMRWGNAQTDITELPNLNQAPNIPGGLTSNIINSTFGNPNLPSTYFTRNRPSSGNGLDTLAGYYNTNAYAPSPYLEDGSRNPSYYRTNEVLSANCLSDFNGYENTQIICSYATTGQTDWKTASTIKNSAGIGYYPSTCCCYRFNPDGNTAGQWYLPAMGELGYMIARFTEINNSISKIQEIFGSSFCCLLKMDINNGYWTSSELSSDAVRYVNGYCYVGVGGKSGDGYVRAFLRA